MNNNVEIDEHDFLLDDSLSDTSVISEPEDSPQSVNIDLLHGSPLNNDFHVVHYNINSITAEGKIVEILEVAKVLKFSVLICTESKLDQTIPTNLICLPGFHEPVRRDRNRHGGGCLIYVANTFTFKHRTELQSDKYEHISIDVRVSEKMFSINCFYRPPNYENHAEFLEESEQILSKLSQHKADTKIIASDLNFGNAYCKYPILAPKP